MVLTKNISNTYQVDFKKLPIVPHWLQEIRNTGMQDFLSVGFPTARKGNEKWKYTNISPIAEIDFRLSENETFNLKEIKESYFVSLRRPYGGKKNIKHYNRGRRGVVVMKKQTC